MLNGRYKVTHHANAGLSASVSSIDWTPCFPVRSLSSIKHAAAGGVAQSVSQHQALMKIEEAVAAEPSDGGAAVCVVVVLLWNCQSPECHHSRLQQRLDDRQTRCLKNTVTVSQRSEVKVHCVLVLPTDPQTEQVQTIT